MEGFVKAVLYLYPKMERLVEDYGEHISNRAYLSFDGKRETAKLVEELADDIIMQGLIFDLKNTMDKIVRNFSPMERFLAEVRYFKRRKNLDEWSGSEEMKKIGSRRNYFRKQNTLLKKVESALKREGVDKDTFYANFEKCECIMSVVKFIESGKNPRSSAKERALFNLIC